MPKVSFALLKIVAPASCAVRGRLGDDRERIVEDYRIAKADEVGM